VTGPAGSARSPRDLESRFGVGFEANYDSGANWDLGWSDGPSWPTVRALADQADLAGAKLRMHRSHSMKALALTAIRMAGAGKLGRLDGGRLLSEPLWMVESEIDDVDFPERPDDDLQATLAKLLLAEAKTAGAGVDDRLIASLIRDRGLGWLIEQAALAGAELPPLTVLSIRYAAHTGPGQATAWRERAEPLTPQDAVAAALTDDEPLPEPAAAALLAQVPALRAELTRTETAIATAARRAGLPGEQIEASLEPGGAGR
jgi:hypothetical protein